MTFSKKYEILFDILDYDNIRYIPIVGGRGSGKSTAVAHLLHDISFTAPHIILNTRFTMASAKDSVIAEMEKTILVRNSENMFNSSGNTLHNLSSQCKIIFKGLKAGSKQQTAKLKSTTNLNIWVLDEAEELHDESVFDDVDDSIRRVGMPNLIIMVLNSHHITKEHFIYKRFFEKKGINWGYNGIKDNVLYIHTTFLDNWNNLSKSAQYKIKELKLSFDLLNNKNELLKKGIITKNKYLKYETAHEPYSDKYRYNYKGELREKAFGVVFKNWSFGNFDNSLPTVCGLDFGVTDPDALVRVAVDNRLRKIYVDELAYQNKLSTSQLLKIVIEKTNKNELIVADSSRPRTINDFKSEGINILPSVKGRGSVLSGIKKIQDYELIITKQSKKVANELNAYKWKINKEIPEDNFNHSIDAIRYACERLPLKIIGISNEIEKVLNYEIYETPPDNAMLKGYGINTVRPDFAVEVLQFEKNLYIKLVKFDNSLRKYILAIDGNQMSQKSPLLLDLMAVNKKVLHTSNYNLESTASVLNTYALHIDKNSNELINEFETLHFNETNKLVLTGAEFIYGLLNVISARWLLKIK